AAHTGGEIDEDDGIGGTAVGVGRLGHDGEVDVVPRTPQLAEGGVAGDAQHPRIERAPPWVEAGGVPPQPLEGLLDDVVSRPVAHDATPDGPYRRSQPL